MKAIKDELEGEKREQSRKTWSMESEPTKLMTVVFSASYKFGEIMETLSIEPDSPNLFFPVTIASSVFVQ